MSIKLSFSPIWLNWQPVKFRIFCSNSTNNCKHFIQMNPIICGIYMHGLTVHNFADFLMIVNRRKYSLNLQFKSRKKEKWKTWMGKCFCLAFQTVNILFFSHIHYVNSENYAKILFAKYDGNLFESVCTQDGLNGKSWTRKKTVNHFLNAICQRQWASVYCTHLQSFVKIAKVHTKTIHIRNRNENERLKHKQRAFRTTIEALKTLNHIRLPFAFMC